MKSRLLKNKIEKYGPITIAEYISIISYHPSYGYYKTHKIGEDFITSPQISKVFGGLIASWFYQIWSKYYDNQEITLVELGSGNADLLYSMLNVFEQLPIKLNIKIIENSESLKTIQKNKLKKFTESKIKIEWYQDLGLINFDENPIFFIANEFFDCLPIHQFLFKDNTLNEILINHSEEKCFHFCLSKKLSNVAYSINKIDGIIEISPQSIAITKYMNSLLKKNKGISLIIDYGYKEPTGKSSLQAVSKHKICSIFDDINNIDISSHVDFQSIEGQFKNCKNKFMTQNEFLTNLKIDKIYNKDYLYNIENDTTMGNLFKVLYSRHLVE